MTDKRKAGRSKAEPTEVTHGAEDFCELHMGDQYAATRRAIVRAASEIGKSIT